jgi:hypothetical protein
MEVAGVSGGKCADAIAKNDDRNGGAGEDGGEGGAMNNGVESAGAGDATDEGPESAWPFEGKVGHVLLGDSGPPATCLTRHHHIQATQCTRDTDIEVNVNKTLCIKAHAKSSCVRRPHGHAAAKLCQMGFASRVETDTSQPGKQNSFFSGMPLMVTSCGGAKTSETPQGVLARHASTSDEVIFLRSMCVRVVWCV